MPNAAYPTQNIHLPSNQAALTSAQLISLAGGIIVLLFSLLILFDLLGNRHIFGPGLVNIPTILALTTSAIAIFFYKKSNKFQLLGFLLILIGGTMIALNFASNNRIILTNGFFFSLIGFSLTASLIRVPHRYHFMQLIALGILIFNLFWFLVSIYHFVSSGVPLGTTFWDSLVFFIICQSIIFIKPDRGFVGLFMTESRSGQMARMSLLYFLTLPLCLGFIFLIMQKMHLFDVDGRLAFLVTVTILVSIIITWINVRLLYNSEVEHFLMREALRVNNITLEMSEEDLLSKVTSLSKENEDVAKKLNNQETLIDLMGSS